MFFFSFCLIFMIQLQGRDQERLKQLIGDWSVGIAMKKSGGKMVYGCGDMSAWESEAGINSEIETQIQGYEDYYENNLWSFDPKRGEVHLFSENSDGEARDHVGKWKDEKTLELSWRGTFEDQDQEEFVLAKWNSEDYFELLESHYSQGAAVLVINYVFKRKKAQTTN
jgi:hypothetical protein